METMTKKRKAKKKPNLGRNPYNEELAANRSAYGRSGFKKSKKAYNRKDRNGVSKRQRWSKDD